MTKDEEGVIRHSLTGGNDCEPYRNYYSAGPGHHKYAELTALVDRGLMVAGRTYNKDGDRYYHVTKAGAAAIGLALPKGGMPWNPRS